MENKKISLMEIAKTFLFIGTIGFGGGMAIVGLMQNYFVEKKKWLKIEEFSHGVALGQFLGPFAVNVAIFIGYRVRGFKGAIVALTSFLTPSITIVIFLTALYLKFHTVPSLQAALSAISPVVIALIFSAALQIGKNKIFKPESIFLILITLFLSIINLQVVQILVLALIYSVLKVRFFYKERGEYNENI